MRDSHSLDLGSNPNRSIFFDSPAASDRSPKILKRLCT
jgi:hypothetical protein